MTPSRSTSTSICLIAHNAYGVIAKKDTGHIGGIEVQVSLMARWLARRGFRVSMITWDDGGTDGEVIDGVTMYKLCRRGDGIRGLRFFTPRWTSYNAALARADAQVYYYNCGDLGLGQTVLWAHARGRKVIFSVSANPDCLRDLPNLATIRDRALYRFGLRRADQIIVQTELQRELLARQFDLDSVVLPMPSAGFTAAAELGEMPRTERKHVLWAGRFHPQKRLDMLLDLAELNPDLIFDVVGEANRPSEYVMNLHERAKRIPNVILHGRVGHAQMAEFYRQSAVMCSTFATFEGFPNVFLEAWSLGVPVITTFDPDNIVAKNGLGRVATTLEELNRGLRECLEPQGWSIASRASIEYFLKHHEVEAAMPRFAEQFASAVA